MTVFLFVCSPESLKQRLHDASEKTVDLGQNIVNVTAHTPQFNRDILKTITVTVHQDSLTGRTQREQAVVRPSFKSLSIFTHGDSSKSSCQWF